MEQASTVLTENTRSTNSTTIADMLTISVEQNGPRTAAKVKVGDQWTAISYDELGSAVHAIGNGFLGPYVLPFELASFVLLAVLVGAIVVSRKELRN